jgi:aspartate-semialdehyde dehydrogenase
VKVAVVGITGIVGETILKVLDERKIAIDELGAFASRDRSEPLIWRGREWTIRAATPEALRSGRFDAVFFASSDDASESLAEHALAGGAVVIDNSAAFRMRDDVPLIVPEVNPHHVTDAHNIFPVANCTAIVLCVALAPIAKHAGLRSVRVATYQAVSGAGRAGLDALAWEESIALAGPVDPFAPEMPGAKSPFVAPIFRNVIPQVGSFDEHGDSGEEKKLAAETRKMLGLPELHVAATTVRVPVRFAHSEAAFIETQRDTTVDELLDVLSKADGVVVHRTGVQTPLFVEGDDRVHVARVRAEGDSKRHFQLWIVGDQVRKGAATNAVQIFELLATRGRFDSAPRSGAALSTGSPSGVTHA